jgi:hypothetical protein
MRCELTRAENANRAAREALRRLLDEDRLDKTLVATMIGRVALQLSINLESIKAIEKIVAESAE